MKPESRHALDAIFRRHEATKLSGEKTNSVQASKDEQFLARFRSVRASVLRPILQEIGELVKTRGYDYEIVEEDERATGEKGTFASIAIHFITSRPAGKSKREYPSFRFTCLSSDERVHLFESTFAPGEHGHSVTVGEVPLEELTPEFVERQLVALARHVFR